MIAELCHKHDVLATAVDQASARVLVIDYDPDIRGWARWREGALEKGKLGRFLRFDMNAFLAARGWHEADSRPLGGVYRSWVFTRADC